MSHRIRVTESSAMLPAATHGQLPQTIKTSRLPLDKSSTASQRLSMASTSSSTRRSSTSLEGSSGPPSSRPSGIPRPSKAPSTARLNTVNSSRPNITLVQRPRVLRNVSDTSVRIAARNRSTDRVNITSNTPRIVNDEDLMSLESSLPPLDIDHDTVFGIAMPQKHLAQPPNLPPRLIPELQALAAAVQRKPNTALSTISTVSSPSTQFTTSPTPWSSSTTATTPTSWSSASPALVQSTRPQLVSKRSQTVPIPSMVRAQMPKLPVLQESARSSASSSKAIVQIEEVRTPKKIKKKTPINSPAPTPPPRTSSVKRSRSRSNSKTEDQAPIASEVAPPLPREEDISPIVKHVEVTANRQNNPSQVRALTDNHKKLQDAINFVSPRPSRDDSDGIDFRRPQIVNVNYTRNNDNARKLLDAAPIEALPQTTSQISLPMTKMSEPELPSSNQPSQSRLAKFSKLALFGRSPKKNSADSDPQQQSRKLQRKGPAAGTGHEGYSKFGRRDRRTSNDGNTTATDSESSVVSTNRKPMRSTSANDRSSRKPRDRSSQSDLDDFVATRLKPVVILGGSQKLNDSLVSRSIKQDGAAASRIEHTEEWSNNQEEDRHVSVTSSGPLMRESRLIFHLDSLDAQDESRLAVRRSQKVDNAGNFRLPKPINTAASLNQPFRSGYNMSQSSIAPTSAALTDASSDLYKVDPQLLEKQRKKSRKLNWGFFRRKEFIPENYQPRTSSRPAAPKMAVRISTMPPARPMPYYAMLESDNEINTTAAVGDFLTEAARVMPASEDGEPASPVEELELMPEPVERTQSVLLPTAPQLVRVEKEPSQVSVNHEPTSYLPQQPAAQLQHKPRQPRLAQVGRIPKVVPTSQPMIAIQAPSSVLPHPGPLTNRQQQSDITPTTAGQPTLEASVNEASHQVADDLGAKNSISAFIRSGIEHIMPTSRTHDKETLRFPDRYSTTSSSSDGVISVMGPPLLPTPEYPTRSVRYTTTEDDVWNEYDDFIDRVTSPSRLKKSRARITDGDKVHPMSVDMYKLPAESQLPMRSNKNNPNFDAPLRPPPLLLGASGTGGNHEADQDFKLRRSRIVSALHSSLDPSSPYSIGDYLAELGEPYRNSGHTSGRHSDSTMSQSGPLSPHTIFAFPEPPPGQSEYRHYENAVHVDELERSKDPVRHSEKSYASLMVARWLSSGQVLLSPAHNDLQKQPERHVLVIDGLGSDDWSIYCAVTYQAEQALIYDLKETGHTRNSGPPAKSGNTPQNFRRRELASFNEAFKFPDNFFSAIVLRFPPVMAESKLKNIVSECRRVLAPGGYMELMLLDIDIVNMGVLTRRAMRELKTKIAMRNREVSLKPVIDNVQSVLGEKGFSKLRRCFVGVPVVGKPPGAETPTSSRSSGTSDKSQKASLANPKPFGGVATNPHHNFSLNDLVADHSDNADAKIGRVVSRTARSWWQHCFEAAVISDGGLAGSIFADRQVLSECKSRASSFKLLIGYTQKPSNPIIGTKRRTMSEPVIATLATAGSS